MKIQTAWSFTDTGISWSRGLGGARVSHPAMPGHTEVKGVQPKEKRVRGKIYPLAPGSQSEECERPPLL